jgi:small subunit ribosomal protein S17
MPRRQLQGTVVSNKMNQTAVVLVERLTLHPLYRKVIRRHKRYKAHDEANAANVGDVVTIEECRPVSKEKRWTIVDWVRKEESA